MNSNQKKIDTKTAYEARELYEKGIRFSVINPSKTNLKKAIDYFTEAANLGHVHASFIVGQALCIGKWESELGSQEAYRHLDTAAKSNHPEAMICFAELHHKNGDIFYSIDEYILALAHGNQVALNRIKALIDNPIGKNYLSMLFEREGETLNPLVQFFIARCYLHGFCIEPNLERAIGWFKESVKGKNAFAAHALGQLYEVGHGVDQDIDMAIDLYKIAAENGFAKGYLSIGAIYHKRANESSPLLQKDHKRTAFEFYEKASELGDLIAFNEMGILHIQGYEFDFPNYYEAFECFLKAADKGNPDAILNLANCYVSGVGVNHDLIKAENYFSALLTQESEISNKAAYGLGVIYLKSVNKKTRKVGRKYLQKAAEGGMEEAKTLLEKTKTFS